jgi:hypothetical protein
MGCNIHTNNATKPMQNIEFMQKKLSNPKIFNIKYSFKYTLKNKKPKQ